VAFVWNGEKEGNADIYVKMVGSETALRLTSNPGWTAALVGRKRRWWVICCIPQ
jgi:hypothetical protein